MNPLLKKLSSFSALVLASVISAQAHALDLRIGVAAEPYPPFASKTPTGQWEGFEIDLVQAICQKIQANCTINEVAWDGIIPALTARRIDVIFASMSITPDRERVISFSIPYYTTASAFIAGPSVQVSDVTPDALRGKVIGVQTATTNADYLRRNYASTSTVRFYNTQDEVNADLLSGRIDLMLADDVGIYDFMKSDQARNLQRVGEASRDPAIFGPGIGAGFRQADNEVREKFNQAINALYESGEFVAIMQRHFTIDLSVPR